MNTSINDKLKYLDCEIVRVDPDHVTIGKLPAKKGE